MKQEQASATAYTVIQGILFASENKSVEQALEPDMLPACKQILEHSAEGRKRISQLNSGLFRLFARSMERFAMPGFYLHYILRKLYIEQVTKQAIEEGFTQFVSLGAGFDTVAWRFHQRFSEVHFIEIDHPATSKEKQQALTNPGENFELLAVDLAEHDMEEVLNTQSQFDKDKKTLFVCEGVLMYLPLAAVEGVFAKIMNLSGSGTRFVFSGVAPDGSPNNNFGWLLRMALRYLGEPLAWSVEKDDIETFLTKQNYRLVESVEDSDLAPRFIPNTQLGKLHRGEYMVLAEAK